MCTPELALTAGIGAINYMSGKAGAKAAYKAQAESTQINQQMLNDKAEVTNQQAALDQSGRMQRGMIERGKIAAIAGESGALGFSSDRLLNDSFMQEGTDIAVMEKNRINEVKHIGYEQDNQKLAGDIGNLAIAAKEPTLLGTGLQIGGELYGVEKAAKTKAITKTL